MKQGREKTLKLGSLREESLAPRREKKNSYRGEIPSLPQLVELYISRDHANKIIKYIINTVKRCDRYLAITSCTSQT